MQPVNIQLDMFETEPEEESDVDTEHSLIIFEAGLVWFVSHSYFVIILSRFASFNSM